MPLGLCRDNGQDALHGAPEPGTGGLPCPWTESGPLRAPPRFLTSSQWHTPCRAPHSFFQCLSHLKKRWHIHSRCSGQEPGKHFHSLHSATLNHPPVSPVSSTFCEAPTVLHPHRASSWPPACPHNAVSEVSPITLSDGMTSLCTLPSALWALSQKPRPPVWLRRPVQLGVA